MPELPILFGANAGVVAMLDTTNRRLSVIPLPANHSFAPSEAWRDGIGLRMFLAKVRQRRPMIACLMLVAATVGSLAGFSYNFIRSQAFSASSELLISNTTLQLSGPDAVESLTAELAGAENEVGLFYIPFFT